jgi:folate-binding protein YgfZ
MDKVELKDISDKKAIFSLIGSQSHETIKSLGINDLSLQNYGDHQTILMEEIPVKIALGSGLNSLGYTFIVDLDQAVELWSKLISLGVIPAGEQVWEYLRIHQGRPYPDAELTEDYNALEAGLWKAISFNKGCYIGQETIARLNTYKGIKQRLFGLKLSQFVEPQTPIMLEGVKIGMLTSCLDNFGLGYIRTKAGGEGLTVNIGEATAEVVSVPFLSHDYYS